jgi:hypothetical protein
MNLWNTIVKYNLLGTEIMTHFIPSFLRAFVEFLSFPTHTDALIVKSDLHLVPPFSPALEFEFQQERFKQRSKWGIAPPPLRARRLRDPPNPSRTLTLMGPVGWETSA